MTSLLNLKVEPDAKERYQDDQRPATESQKAWKSSFPGYGHATHLWPFRQPLRSIVKWSAVSAKFVTAALRVILVIAALYVESWAELGVDPLAFDTGPSQLQFDSQVL